MQRHICEQYWSVGHCGFLECVSVTLVDETDPSNPLKREGYSRYVFCTMVPYVINIEDRGLYN